MDMFYSTPSRYLKALHDADREWTTKSDDSFPYANNAYSYWTGNVVCNNSLLLNIIDEHEVSTMKLDLILCNFMECAELKLELVNSRIAFFWLTYIFHRVFTI